MKIYLDLQKYSNINNHTKQKKGAYASRARTPALQIYDIQKKLFSIVLEHLVGILTSLVKSS